jgi:hypothetical protein
MFQEILFVNVLEKCFGKVSATSVAGLMWPLNDQFEYFAAPGPPTVEHSSMLIG